MRDSPRVAIVHDWLTGMRGGERCLEVFCDLFPAADIFTLVHRPGAVSPAIERHRIRTSFVQDLPAATRRYRAYLPLFPFAVERFDLSGYDRVISISHCVAKGAVPPPGADHLCYCLTPVRYAWDMAEAYFGGMPAPARWGVEAVLAGLRRWDARTASRVTRFVAISRHVADRVARHYDRAASVLYPPVDCARFAPPARDRAPEDFDLVVSALVPYKRVDLAVAAATRLSRRLLVVGTGPEETRLRRLAGPTVSFLGWRGDAEIADLYARCRAFLFPGEEDFGITPLEAMASGRPVVAFGRGGALETVVGLDAPSGEPPTGIFFAEQTVEGLAAALALFDRRAADFDPAACRRRAERFDLPRFREAARRLFGNGLAEPPEGP